MFAGQHAVGAAVKSSEVLYEEAGRRDGAVTLFAEREVEIEGYDSEHYTIIGNKLHFTCGP